MLNRWRGIALTTLIVTATGYLAVSGQLGTYIHPRYFVFTMVLCGVAAVGCVLAWFVMPRTGAHDHHDHDHDHDHDHGPVQVSGAGARGRVRAVARCTATLVVVAGLAVVLALPPHALGAEAASTRAGDPVVGAAGPSLDLSQLATADYASFTLRDWASLLAQGATPSFLAGHTANMTGFVMPAPNGSADVLMLTRLTITCCAVDAQPAGVPVHVPDWATTYRQGDWLTVQGAFVSNPDAASTLTVVVDPSTITAIPQPAEPYAY